MIKKLIKFSIFTFLVASGSLFALDPTGMLEDGKRAYELANYEESREILERFLETWPEHEKINEALYFHTLASAKTIDSRIETYRSQIGKELKDAIASLSLEVPNLDITEAKVALKIAENQVKPELWDELVKISPKELKHYLYRGWYPEPSKNPYSALNWVKMKLNNASDLDSETKASVALIKIEALWKLLNSPLAVAEQKNKLEQLDSFPLDKAFKEILNFGFKNGNLEQKRKIAIYGYHFDYFKNNTLTSNKAIKSSWLRYLKSRGISFENTWCP